MSAGLIVSAGRLKASDDEIQKELDSIQPVSNKCRVFF